MDMLLTHQRLEIIVVVVSRVVYDEQMEHHEHMDENDTTLLQIWLEIMVKMVEMDDSDEEVEIMLMLMGVDEEDDIHDEHELQVMMEEDEDEDDDTTMVQLK